MTVSRPPTREAMATASDRPPLRLAEPPKERRFPRRLFAAGPGPGQNSGFPVVRVEANPALEASAHHRFRPQSLPPGHAVDLRVTVRVTHCLPAGQAATFGELPVEFRLLGMVRRTTL